MATTRSKTKGEHATPAGKPVERTVSGMKKDRNVEMLSDLVQQGRQVAKTTVTKKGKANEDEKDPMVQKITHTHVESSIVDMDKIQVGKNGGNLNHRVHSAAHNELGICTNDKKQKKHGMGRGGGGHSSFSVTAGEDALGSQRQDILRKKNYFLDQHTSIMDICGWPLQALVQVLLKIELMEFGIVKEHITKYNPKFLRRLVIEMRNDLRDAEKTRCIETTIRNTTGIFSIDTKRWEFDVYDDEEIKKILEQYLEIAYLEEETAKVQDMTGDEVRQVLLGMQTKMLDAELEPHNVYVQFDYFRDTIQNGIDSWGKPMIEKNDDNSFDFATSTCEIEENSVIGDKSQNRKVDSEALQSNIIKSYELQTEDVEWDSIYFSKDTHAQVLSQWSGFINIMILNEWYEEHNIDFDDDFFKNMSSSALRYQVFMLQSYLEEDNASIKLKVKKNAKHTFSNTTQDWEILALDDQDMPVMYKRFCHTKNCKPVAKTNDAMYAEIMDTIEKMGKDGEEEVIFSVCMNMDFSNMVSHLNVRNYRLNRKEVGLNILTMKEEILTWCNKTLITITAKVMDRYGFVMKADLKKIAPRVLRKYLLEVQRFLLHNQGNETFRSDVPNLGIFNPDMLDWEIENLTIKELRAILQLNQNNKQSKIKWHGCWNKSKMQDAVKQMKIEYKNVNSLSGIKFQTEECEAQEYSQFVKHIRHGKGTKISPHVKEQLLSFNLYDKDQDENRVAEKNDDEMKSTEFTADTLKTPAGKRRKAESGNMQAIDLTAIEDNTKALGKTNIYTSDDGKLDMLAQAARITPMKNLTTSEKTDSMHKGPNGHVGMINRRKSERIEKKNAIDYKEQEEVPMEGDNDVNIIVEIRADMEDWEIHDMTDNVARATYKNCMALRNLILSDEEVNAKSRKEIIDNLFAAREQEKEIQACIKDMEADELRGKGNEEEELDHPDEALGFECQDDDIWNGTSQLLTQDSNNNKTLVERKSMSNKDSTKDTGVLKTKGVDVGQEDETCKSRLKVGDIVSTTARVHDSKKTSNGDGIDINQKEGDNEGVVEITIDKEINEKQSERMEVDNDLMHQGTIHGEQKASSHDTFYVENEVHNEWKVVGTSKKQTEQHSVPFRGLIGHSAQNLLGMEVNEFTPNQNIGNKNSSQVVAQKQSMYILRVNLAAHTKETNHAPTFVKKFTRVLRQADATLKVLPFDLNNKNSNDIITNEKDFPDVEEQIYKWAVGVRKTRYHKLEFSLRVEMTVTFRTLKNMIFDWCSKNACYVVFNNIESETIFRAGWIQGLHPFFHNRNKIRYLLSKSAPHLREKISVYSRTVVQKNKDKTKTYCEALAIDGDFKHKDAILKMLCEAQKLLSVEYKSARYFPFRRNNFLTADDQRKAMKNQNQYNDSTNMKDVAVTDPWREHQVVNRKVKYNFIAWMKKFQVHGNLIFSEVEAADNGKLRLIYTSDYEPQVCELIANLYAHTEIAFGKEVTSNLLGDEGVYSHKKDLYSAESMLAYECAQHFRSLPDEKGKEASTRMRNSSRSYAQATKTTASSAVVIEEINDDKMEIDKNNSTTNSRTKNNSTEYNSTDNAVNAQIAELSQAVTKLQEQISHNNVSIVKNQEDNLSMRNMEIKVEEQRKEFMGKLEDVQQGYKKDLRKTEKKLVGIIEEEKEKVTQQIVGMKTFFQDNLQESERRAVERADAQKQASDKILDILLGRSTGNQETPKVVEPQTSSHCGGVR